MCRKMKGKPAIAYRNNVIIDFSDSLNRFAFGRA